MKSRVARAGDTAHMTSPRAGAGAHAGVRDAVAFKAGSGEGREAGESVGAASAGSIYLQE